jgi:DNA-binding MarR family transcriptional regulator
MARAPIAFRQTPGDRALVQLAKKILVARQLRLQVFPAGMFCEPAWDILLSLYSQPSGGYRSISTLAECANAAVGTTIRWVKYLEEEGLLTREVNGGDRNGELVHLTDKAFRALQFYLAQTLRDGQ